MLVLVASWDLRSVRSVGDTTELRGRDYILVEFQMVGWSFYKRYIFVAFPAKQ